MHIALAACARALDLGGELDLILPALASTGLTAEPVAWDDLTVDWSRFDAVAVRATWDYIERVDAYRAWIDAVEAVTKLVNPPAILRWNTDKRYLAELAAAGVPIVDTAFVAPGADVEAPDWPDVVVKPSVSAGGRLSGRFPGGDARIEETIGRIHAEGNVAMLQPYEAAVDGEGEANVLVFGGVPSHAVAKGGILPPGYEPALDDALYLDQSIRPLPLTAELTDFAEQVLAAIPSERPLVYARIDSIVAGDGTRRLMEAELVEPFLYLADAPDPSAAAARYAQALAAALSAP